MEAQWLTRAKRLQAIASTGLHYAKDEFDQRDTARSLRSLTQCWPIWATFPLPDPWLGFRFCKGLRHSEDRRPWRVDRTPGRSFWFENRLMVAGLCQEVSPTLGVRPPRMSCGKSVKKPGSSLRCAAFTPSSIKPEVPTSRMPETSTNCSFFAIVKEPQMRRCGRKRVLSHSSGVTNCPNFHLEGSSQVISRLHSLSTRDPHRRWRSIEVARAAMGLGRVKTPSRGSR